MYLTNTRPDITFSVHQLSHFLDKPTIAHYNAAIRILKYIKGAPSLGLFFSSRSSIHLKAFMVVFGTSVVIQETISDWF